MRTDSTRHEYYIDRYGEAQETTPPRLFSVSPPNPLLTLRNAPALNLLKIDTDHDGHGTFVAGVAAGKTYGVCKSCNVHSVKVRVFTVCVHCLRLLCVVHPDTVTHTDDRLNFQSVCHGSRCSFTDAAHLLIYIPSFSSLTPSLFLLLSSFFILSASLFLIPSASFFLLPFIYRYSPIRVTAAHRS